MSESEMPVCPQCERSDMVRLYYERHFCDRCCGWLHWLQGSAEWETRRKQRKTLPVEPLVPEAAPAETAQREEVEVAPPPVRRKGKATVQTWECPQCHARYGRPKGAGVCPACAMGENPETVVLVPLEEGA